MNRKTQFARTLSTLLLATMISSCAPYDIIQKSPPSARLQLPENTSTTYVYECDGGSDFSVNIKEQTAWIFLPGQTLNLPVTQSASGVKYSDGHTIFWTKGQEALLQVEDKDKMTCKNNPFKAVWEHAKLTGVDFRAVGNEPGWNLDIYPDVIHYVGSYGEVDELFLRPQAVSNNSERTTSYLTENNRNTLQILIEATTCYDSMSEHKYSTSVTIWFNGNHYMGCGKPLH